MKRELLDEIMRIKSGEYHCEHTAFTEPSRNLVIVDDEVAFRMITFGWATVVVTKNALYADLKELLANEGGIFCFDAPQLCTIDQLLRQQNHALGEIYEFYMPVSRPHLTIDKRFRVSKLTKAELGALDQGERFSNALCTEDSFELNEFAYVAMDDDVIASIAGVSSNTERLWWVGVDTNSDYRGQGLASFLVNRVRQDVLAMHKIPVYPTWYSNIGSVATAIRAGFMPGYVEISARCAQP